MFLVHALEIVFITIQDSFPVYCFELSYFLIIGTPEERVCLGSTTAWTLGMTVVLHNHDFVLPIFKAMFKSIF